LIGPRKFDVIFLGPDLNSAVTFMRILVYYSTFVQPNVSQLQSFRDQGMHIHTYICIYSYMYQTLTAGISSRLAALASMFIRCHSSPRSLLLSACVVMQWCRDYSCNVSCDTLHLLHLLHLLTLEPAFFTTQCLCGTGWRRPTGCLISFSAKEPYK